MGELITEQRRYPERWLTDTHDFHQLLIGLEGAVDVEVAGRGGRVTALAGCIIPAGTAHHYFASRTDNSNLVLDLPLDLLPALPERDTLQHLFEQPRFFAVDANLQALLRAVARELESPSALKRYGLGLGVLAALGERQAHARPAPSRLNLATLDTYIERHLHQPLDVATLAAFCHLSRSQFTRLFKAATGQSPYAYVREKRLASACTLLSTTPLPITEVALRTGFTTPSAFSTAFTRRYGMSPRTWRSHA